MATFNLSSHYTYIYCMAATKHKAPLLRYTIQLRLAKALIPPLCNHVTGVGSRLESRKNDGAYKTSEFESVSTSLNRSFI